MQLAVIIHKYTYYIIWLGLIWSMTMRIEYTLNGMKILSVQEYTHSKMGLIYTKVSMTTYITCTLGQFTEEREEEEEEDGENRGLAVFSV